MKPVRKFFAGLTLLSFELIVMIVLFLAGVICFAFFTREVFSLHDTDFDRVVFQAVKPYINDLNTSLMEKVSFFGSTAFLLPANILLLIYFLFVRKHTWYSIRVPVISLGSYLLMSNLKVFFGRIRPLHPVADAAWGFSYPSGHATSAMAFYGLLIYIVWTNVDRKPLRNTLICLLIVAILTIGFSRIYLRVHFASDVLAGFSLGLVWLVLSLWSIGRIESYIGKKQTLQ